MKNTPLIITIKDNVVESVHPTTKETCEKDFLAHIQGRISNWDEYTQDDIDAILEQGYETFGNGSVCLTWV